MRTSRAAILLLLVVLLLTACDESYTVTYPAEYTPRYCYDNYVEADPNLLYLEAAQNSLGSFNPGGGNIHYHAIRDVPMEAYLCTLTTVLLGWGPRAVVQHKDLHEHAILDYTIASVELFWRKGQGGSSDPPFERHGTGLYYMHIADLDAAAFKAHLIECLETEQYFPVKWREIPSGWSFIPRDIEEDGVKSNVLLFLRVTFSEYPGLVWDAYLLRGPAGEIHFAYYTPAEEGGSLCLIPVSDEILGKIPSA